MSETVLLWILGGELAIVGSLFGILWKHVNECRDFRSSVATMKTDLEHVVKELGSHDSGVRGSLHKLRGDITPLVLWAQMEMEKRDR